MSSQQVAPYRPSRRVRIGVLLGTRYLVMKGEREGHMPAVAELLELASAAEAEGLDSIWVGDSLVSKPRLEPLSMLSALAAHTMRIRLGTAVLLPALRPPVPLAQTLATVDILSEGRLTVAAGVGGAFTEGQKQDWLAAGFAPETRAGRLTETVQILKTLWSQDHVTFEGRHFHFDNLTLRPRPVQPGGPPILLGTHARTGSQTQYRRAAQWADGMISITDSPEQFRATATTVANLVDRAGRDPSQFQKVMYLTVNVNEDEAAAAREADDFLVSYYGVRHWGDRWGPFGAAHAVAQRMREYAEAGADHLVVRFASWDQPEQFGRFVTEVVPVFEHLHSNVS